MNILKTVSVQLNVYKETFCDAMKSPVIFSTKNSHLTNLQPVQSISKLGLSLSNYFAVLGCSCKNVAVKIFCPQDYRLISHVSWFLLFPPANFQCWFYRKTRRKWSCLNLTYESFLLTWIALWDSIQSGKFLLQEQKLLRLFWYFVAYSKRERVKKLEASWNKFFICLFAGLNIFPSQ